jgi:hypothetical protein
MDGNTVGASSDTELFNGNLVTGTKTADHPDLCWGTSGDHTYRATVTAFLPSTKPNGDYTFGALKCNDTSGGNPWITGSAGPVLWEGASLVATYRNSGTGSDKVAIFDALTGADSVAGSGFTVTMSTGSATPLSGSGLFTQVGADGQTGASFSSGSATETDTFNGSLLAGPGGGPYPQSNWDGSDGWPMPELWDTHTLDVSLSGGSTNTDSTTAPSDCIAATVYVLQQGGF